MRDMKNGKRILAVLGISILLAAVSLPMFFAFGTGEGSEGRFRASWAVAIVVPVMGYVFWLIYRVLNRRRAEPEGKIRNIIFDVGNVLVTFDWKSYLDSFGFPEEEKQAFIKGMFTHPVWNERDRGSLPDEEYLNQCIRQIPGYEEDVRRVWEGIRHTISPRDYSLTWTGYLKERGYKLYILSNYSARVLEETKEFMTFRRNMDGEIFSCNVHLCKPEPEIYQTLLERYKLVPGECVFIDDSEANCEGAREAGMYAVHFRDFKQGVSELQKLGVY